jgi:hypothetical protein
MVVLPPQLDHLLGAGVTTKTAAELYTEGRRLNPPGCPKSQIERSPIRLADVGSGVDPTGHAFLGLIEIRCRGASLYTHQLEPDDRRQYTAPHSLGQPGSTRRQKPAASRHGLPGAGFSRCHDRIDKCSIFTRGENCYRVFVCVRVQTDYDFVRVSIVDADVCVPGGKFEITPEPFLQQIDRSHNSPLRQPCSSLP